MKLATTTTLAHIHLDAATSVSIAVDNAQVLGLYVLDGPLADASGPALGVGTLAILTPGDPVSIAATPDRPLDVALLGGAPVQGPVLFRAPS